MKAKTNLDLLGKDMRLVKKCRGSLLLETAIAMAVLMLLVLMATNQISMQMLLMSDAAKHVRTTTHQDSGFMVLSAWVNRAVTIEVLDDMSSQNVQSSGEGNALRLVMSNGRSVYFWIQPTGSTGIGGLMLRCGDHATQQDLPLAYRFGLPTGGSKVFKREVAVSPWDDLNHVASSAYAEAGIISMKFTMVDDPNSFVYNRGVVNLGL